MRTRMSGGVGGDRGNTVPYPDLCDGRRCYEVAFPLDALRTSAVDITASATKTSGINNEKNFGGSPDSVGTSCESG